MLNYHMATNYIKSLQRNVIIVPVLLNAKTTSDESKTF